MKVEIVIAATISSSGGTGILTPQKKQVLLECLWALGKGYLFGDGMASAVLSLFFFVQKQEGEFLG